MNEGYLMNDARSFPTWDHGHQSLDRFIFALVLFEWIVLFFEHSLRLEVLMMSPTKIQIFFLAALNEIDNLQEASQEYTGFQV